MVIVREPSSTQSGTCRKSNKQGQTNDVQKANWGHLVDRSLVCDVIPQLKLWA